MQPADEPARPAQRTADGASRSPISVAILAAVACVPLVIAAGFLTDRAGTAASVPGDISVLALRGALDAPAQARTDPPQRAAY